MELHIISLYPETFHSFLEGPVLKRGASKGLFHIELHQLRDYATDIHRSVDAKPFGGGPGMLLRYDILYQAWKGVKEKIREKNPTKSIHSILPSPRGKPFQQRDAERFLTWKEEKSFLFICGRFEGVDERFVEDCIDEELSLGDFVLSGGELATMAIVDTVVRMLPQSIGNKYSKEEESFSLELNNRLEYPQYTFPRSFRGRRVPHTLLSGDHKRIANWREEESKKVTQKRRPDLMKE